MATHRARLDRRDAWAGSMGRQHGQHWPASSPSRFFTRFSDKFPVLLVTFFLILPILNGLWGWGSWWVSRWLGRDLLARLDDRSASQRAWTIAWHALADLALAILFLLSLGWFLAFTFEAYNQFAQLHDGQPAYDLAAYISNQPPPGAMASS